MSIQNSRNKEEYQQDGKWIGTILQITLEDLKRKCKIRKRIRIKDISYAAKKLNRNGQDM